MKTGRRLFSFCSLENKYLDGGLAGRVFWGFLASWGVWWLAGGDAPSRVLSIGIKALAGFFWQSIEVERLIGKALIALDLGALLRLRWVPGMGGFASVWRGTPISSRAKSQA